MPCIELINNILFLNAECSRPNHARHTDQRCAGWQPLIFIFLALTATIDARRGRVPDGLILGGFFFTIAIEGFSAGWPFAGQHLAMGFAAGLLLYLINEFWYRFMKRDAFGMGDAKWTMLAVSCFGPLPALIAWALGAWLALAWMGAMRMIKRPITRVHFAPFLLIGLCAGIYWLRLR